MRFLLLAFALTTWSFAADKPVAPVSMEDEYVQITGFARVDRPSVTTLLGSDPGIDVIVVEVKVNPRGDNKINVNYDDFTLLSRKDGQRSQPLAPAQIAGQGALVVVQGGGGGGGGMMNGSRGPMWGGVPGTNTRPKRVGGDGETGAVAPPGETSSAIKNDKENPLLATLKEKALPQRETNDPVNGLLYFLFEGKHKLKDIELMYKSPAGRLILDFQK